MDALKKRTIEHGNKSLLIIGAGGHGHVVAEIAETLGYEFSFLDDHYSSAIGRTGDIEIYINQFSSVFVAIGNNVTRRIITERVKKLGKNPLTLIHPSAYVSPSATIGEGTVIAAGAIVHTRSQIGEGCILSIGAIVDHDVIVESFVHLNAGSICKAGSHIESGKKLDAGEIALGY